MIEERIKSTSLKGKVITAEDAANFVKDGMRIGTSGSTSSGYPVSFFKALLKRAKKERKLSIELWSAAPLGKEIDGDLVEAGLIKRRLCHQSNPIMAKGINNGNILYSDMGTYNFPNQVRYKFFGDLDLCVVEGIFITKEGGIVPSSCMADAPSFLKIAKNIIIEINTTIPISMAGIHDVYIPENPPHREPIPLKKVGDRIGTYYIPIDSNKVVGIIMSDEVVSPPSAEEEGDEISQKIAKHLITFFEDEVKKGRLPKNLLPLQTGLGTLATAFLKELANSEFTNIETFSALLSDPILDLIDMGKIKMASGTGLYFSSEGLSRFYNNIEKYKRFMILRPVDISASPELIQRLGVIAFNGAVEVDIYGHVNSSHLGGGRVISGVAGSIEYARNGYLSIFMTPSVGKGGNISRIVPMVPHVDHTEHEVHVIVTEEGLADLRGLDPRERARLIISNCAHPDYRPLLNDYLEIAEKESVAHEPHVLDKAFSFHLRLKETKSMKKKKI